MFSLLFIKKCYYFIEKCSVGDILNKDEVITTHDVFQFVFIINVICMYIFLMFVFSFYSEIVKSS